MTKNNNVVEKAFKEISAMDCPIPTIVGFECSEDYINFIETHELNDKEWREKMKKRVSKISGPILIGSGKKDN